MFGANYIVKNRAKSKYVYIGYGIAFNGLGSWSFGNDFARNVIIFGVDNSSSSQADDCKINFLVLGEGSTISIFKTWHDFLHKHVWFFSQLQCY